MTIHEVLSRIDNEYPNDYPPERKIEYISRLDWNIKNNIIDKHEGGDGVSFSGYDINTPEDTVLIVPDAFADMYIFWLQGWIDYWNGDYKRYNNAIAMYQTIYEAFSNDYHSKHLPNRNAKLRLW